jgi:hypothetical protein
MYAFLCTFIAPEGWEKVSTGLDSLASCKHHLAKPNIAECSLRPFLQKKTHPVFKMFTAPMETDSKFIHSSVATAVCNK